MSSVQLLRGLPRRLFPATMPCRTCVQRLSARTTWPKYCSFLLLTSVRKRRAGSNSSNIELLVLCSVQLILNILLYMSISNAFSLLRSIIYTSQKRTQTVDFCWDFPTSKQWCYRFPCNTPNCSFPGWRAERLATWHWGSRDPAYVSTKLPAHPAS